MLYSKNGSIPKAETDGTEGWVEVPDKPEAPEGKEVVWWFPPGWVIRDFKPADEEGFVWKWSQSAEMWVKYELPPLAEVVVSVSVSDGVISLTSGDIAPLTSGDIAALTSGDIAPLTTDQISGLE